MTTFTTIQKTHTSAWIGVNLDRTLAHYTTYKPHGHIGPPIPAMLARVRAWIAEGKNVRIFTARVFSDGSHDRAHEAHINRRAIEQWCLHHIGCILPVTCQKDFDMIELWDDRAMRVVPNVGEPCCATVTMEVM